MRGRIGIRRETKDSTQRRAPLAPAHVRRLVSGEGIEVVVQPWENRVFPDSEYAAAGAAVSDDLSGCNIVFGVKEIHPPHLADGSVYAYFSHTVKGQEYNMPMLREILERRITLFDYEMVKDAKGKRLVFFGPFAGYAGMIDTLWALGKRLAWEKMETPFAAVRYASEYDGLAAAKEALRDIGKAIAARGLPARLTPFVCGFTGYGQVSKAAQELYDLLPTETIAPAELAAFMTSGRASAKKVYKVEFRKPDLYAAPEGGFNLDRFNADPGSFRNRFPEYLPHLTLVVNGIYWEPRFPRLVTADAARALWAGGDAPRLRVIGDITCDIGGSIELTVKETNIENPVFVWDPATGAAADGWEGRGPVVMAVDKLPTELPREASESFGASLARFVPGLARADFSLPAARLDVPPEFRGALIAHAGELAPGFEYLRGHLSGGGSPDRDSHDS